MSTFLYNNSVWLRQIERGIFAPRLGWEHANGEELHQEDCRASGSWVGGQSPGSGSVPTGKLSICSAFVSMAFQILISKALEQNKTMNIFLPFYLHKNLWMIKEDIQI